MKTCRITIDLLDRYQLDVEVEFEYESYNLGVRYHPDGSGTPPSGDYIEVTEVRVLSITDNLHDQTIERQWLIDLGLAEKLDLDIYDMCYNSEPGEAIYDAIYNSREDE